MRHPTAGIKGMNHHGPASISSFNRWHVPYLIHGHVHLCLYLCLCMYLLFRHQGPRIYRISSLTAFSIHMKSPSTWSAHHHLCAWFQTEHLWNHLSVWVLPQQISQFSYLHFPSCTGAGTSLSMPSSFFLHLVIFSLFLPSGWSVWDLTPLLSVPAPQGQQ